MKHVLSGFSLIEMIVVIAIMAVIAAIAVPLVGVVMNREHGDATVAEMQHIKTCLEAYYEDNLEFPKTLNELEKGGYISSSFSSGDAFTDSWGNEYKYAKGDETAKIASLGEDQIDSAKNLTLTVSGTFVLQSQTREERKTIHIALQNYEILRGSDTGGGGGGETITVDNTDPGFTNSGFILPGFFGCFIGTNYYQTKKKGNWAKWTPDLPSSGTYTVEGYWKAGSKHTTKADYTIIHAGGKDHVSKTQKSGCAWVTLGSWEFKEGKSGYVKLDVDDKAWHMADAIRFVEGSGGGGGESSYPNLPSDWYKAGAPDKCALGILITNGFLPNNDKYISDSWGDEYVYEGSPADYVTSKNL